MSLLLVVVGAWTEAPEAPERLQRGSRGPREASVGLLEMKNFDSKSIQNQASIVVGSLWGFCMRIFVFNIELGVDMA